MNATETTILNAHNGRFTARQAGRTNIYRHSLNDKVDTLTSWSLLDLRTYHNAYQTRKKTSVVIPVKPLRVAKTYYL